ncbi:MAG: hypothetical protein H7X86_02835 [Gorillibacterium sp.]|nr:hypothetical protein [Gorillibacterium sp.]
MKTVGMNLGGTFEVPFARFKMVQAYHSSSVTTEDDQNGLVLKPGAALTL